MKLLAQDLPSNRGIEEAPTRGTNQDQLIARGLQKEQYIGILGLVIALITAVGLISRRVEYAMIFAFILSAILITFFLFI